MAPVHHCEWCVISLMCLTSQVQARGHGVQLALMAKLLINWLFLLTGLWRLFVANF